MTASKKLPPIVRAPDVAKIGESVRELHQQLRGVSAAGKIKTGKRGGRPNSEVSERAVQAEIEKGTLPPAEKAQELETWQRREQAWRLHLKGVSRNVMAKFFNVAPSTIDEDLARYNDRLQGEMSVLGAAGVIARSYSFYDALRADVSKMLDDLDADWTELRKGKSLSMDDLLMVVRERAAVLRLAKDVEDSKMRMMMTIGLLPRSPKNALTPLGAPGSQDMDGELQFLEDLRTRQQFVAATKDLVEIMDAPDQPE